MGGSTLVAQSTSRVSWMAVPLRSGPATDDGANSHQAIKQNEKEQRPCGRGLTAFANTGLST